jgi:hypothetical protein
MQIGGKEYKVGQRIRIINAKSVLHYRYGMAGDCNEDMTGNGYYRLSEKIRHSRNADNGHYHRT